MSTAYNGRDRAPHVMAFSGKLTKVTGESEQVELLFTAASGAELAERLEAAGRAATARLHANNDAIMRAGDTLEERQRQAYGAAVASLRKEVTTMLEAHRRHEEEEPLPPDDEEEEAPAGPEPDPGDAPAEEEKTHADVATGPLHAPADP